MNPRRLLSPTEKCEWLRRYGSARAALEALPHIAQRGKKTFTIPAVSDIERQAGHKVVRLG